MMRRISVALALIALLATSTLHAQSHTVRGTIQEFGSTIGTRALPGATVHLSQGNRTAVTDASGAYAFTNVPRGTYDLRVTAPGHESLTTRVTVTGDMTLNYVLQIREVVHVSITGVVSESGDFVTRPLAGATVRAMPGGYAATTDANGRFTLSNIPNGAYTFTASAGGHKSVSRKATFNSNGTINFTLPTSTTAPPTEQPARGLSGVIRNSDGRSVAGASIRLTPGNYQATTNKDGRFSLSNVPAGTYTAHIRADGYRPVNDRVTIGSDRTIDFSIGVARGDDDNDKVDRDDDGDRKDHAAAKKEKKEKKEKKNGNGKGKGHKGKSHK
jgi:hypothetical protein